MKHTKQPWEAVGLYVRQAKKGIIAHCPIPQHGGVFECMDNAQKIALLYNSTYAAGYDPAAVKALVEAAEKAILVLAQSLTGLVAYRQLDTALNDLRQALAAVKKGE